MDRCPPFVGYTPCKLTVVTSKLEEVTLSLISTLLTDWGQARPKQTLGELFFDVLLLFSAAVLEALPGERELGRWD